MPNNSLLRHNPGVEVGTAIILAAGRGNRLGALTRRQPKCLLRVGPKTLLDHQLAALAAHGIDRVVVVVGYHGELIQQKLNGRVTCLPNPVHASTNSLYSFWLARDYARAGFLLLNADVLFHPEILRRVLASPYPEALAVERRRVFTPEEMKVELSGDRILALSKSLPPERAHAENVGLLKFSADGARALFAAMESLVADGGARRFCPYAFNAIASTHPLYAVPVDDLPWVEIDFPQDLRRARREIWPAIEDPTRRGEKPAAAPALSAANPSSLPCN